MTEMKLLEEDMRQYYIEALEIAKSANDTLNSHIRILNWLIIIPGIMSSINLIIFIFKHFTN